MAGFKPGAWARRPSRVGVGAALLAAVAVAGVAAGCGADPAPGLIQAVGAENQYANVISQIGGRYVQVTAVVSNPNTDPHSFQASAQVARTLSSAELVVQNGLGYDTFMGEIEAASPNSSRRVIDVRRLLGLPDSTRNPHLWYEPSTMPRVAAAVARDLSAIDPAHRAYFEANASAFTRSLAAWSAAVAGLRADFDGVPVATTEPVADYLLQAAGLDNLTPWTFQAAVMNGVDPSAQDVSRVRALFTGHRVRAFVYNRQVTDSLTQSLLQLARQNGIPVVAVYETMPAGHDYQTWMTAEVNALRVALAEGRSTTSL